jgi:hypothetical protein
MPASVQGENSNAQAKARSRLSVPLLLGSLFFGVILAVTFRMLAHHASASGGNPAPSLLAPRVVLLSLRFLVLLFMVLLLLFKSMGPKVYSLFGAVKHLLIQSPAFEDRIRQRYRSEMSQLASLGFDQVFFFGEGFSAWRLLLVFPALTLITMLRKREALTLMNGRVVMGYPIFAAGDKSAFAHPFALGVKFHTVFQDGTLLVSKTFAGDTVDRSGIVVEQREAGIGEMWDEHQQKIRELEAAGKRVNRDISFQAYSEISRRESAPPENAS